MRMDRLGATVRGLALGAALAALATTALAAPDFSGVWRNHGQRGLGGATFGAPQAPLPFTPEAKAKVDRYQALVRPTGDSPGGVCLGTGMPGSMLGSGGYPMQIIQRPDEMTIIYEAHSEIRRVYFGDRIMPAADRIPGRNGVSSGRWEGDTLVVETDNLVEQVDQRFAHSDQARIEERYSLSTDPDGTKVLTAQMTMTDPVFYTEPVKAEKKWALDAKGYMLPYECNDENWRLRLEELQAKAAAGVAPPAQ